MIEYKSGERLGYIKKSPHSPECVSSIKCIQKKELFIYANQHTRCIARKRHIRK